MQMHSYESSIGSTVIRNVFANVAGDSKPGILSKFFSIRGPTDLESRGERTLVDLAAEVGKIAPSGRRQLMATMTIVEDGDFTIDMLEAIQSTTDFIMRKEIRDMTDVSYHLIFQPIHKSILKASERMGENR